MLFNSGIGVDIRDDQVNIVFLKGSFKGVRVAAQSHCSLDNTRTQNEIIKDVADFINKFISEHHILATGIFAGIPGDISISREIEFPLAVKENLRATLLYEMEKYIPISVEDIYFDYQIISEDKKKEIFKVLLVVVRKKDFDPYIQLATLLNKGISGVEIISSAVSNYYFNQPEISPEISNDPAVLIYFRNNGSDIILTRHQAIVYARSIGQPDDGAGEDKSLVVKELTKVRSMFLEQDKPVKLAFFGAPVKDELISQISREEFDILSANKSGNGVSDDRYIPAFGLALRGIKKVPVNMNIMPIHLRTQPDRTSYLIMAVLVALFIVSGIVWAGSHVVAQRNTVSRLDAELGRLRLEVASVEKIKDAITAIEDRVHYFESLRPGNIYVVDVMREITKIIPETAWIKEFKLIKNELSIYGEAASASELIPLLETSLLFKNVKFLSTIRKGKDDKEIFRIGLTISGGRK